MYSYAFLIALYLRNQISYGSLAQLVEQGPRVTGSSPVRSIHFKEVNMYIVQYVDTTAAILGIYGPYTCKEDAQKVADAFNENNLNYAPAFVSELLSNEEAMKAIRIRAKLKQIRGL